MEGSLFHSPLAMLTAGFLLGFLVAVLAYYWVLYPRTRATLEEQFQKRKSEFIGLASHYLLTPITIIQAAVTQLQEKGAFMSGDERNHHYDTILLGQQRLWLIVEQLILVNDIDQNRLELKLGVNDIAETVESAIRAVDVFARHKLLKIQFENRIGELHESRYDRRLMLQAVIAVIDNAIKFSVEGMPVTVRLSEASGIATIDVEDLGAGMSRELIDHLGETFYRGTSIYNFDHEGIGLGLHIAQAILHEHQGSIVFDSLPERGTKVSIQFPIS